MTRDHELVAVLAQGQVVALLDQDLAMLQTDQQDNLQRQEVDRVLVQASPTLASTTFELQQVSKERR
jgi:hypothetical protein